MPLENPGSFSPLDVRQLGKREFELLADFIYHDEEEGPIVVDAGFRTDFASIQPLRNMTLFPVFALLAGYGNHAATIHDWLYVTKKTDRKTADEVFFRALRDEGIARWRAYIFFAGVRLFGGFFYNKR